MRAGRSWRRRHGSGIVWRSEPAKRMLVSRIQKSRERYNRCRALDRVRQAESMELASLPLEIECTMATELTIDRRHREGS